MSSALDPSIVVNTKIPDPWTVGKALAAAGLDEPLEGSGSPIRYFHLLERLKTTKREGWKRFGIYHGESIADHSFRMAMMVMLLPQSLKASLDVPKCVTMCLIHDMAESLVGDITPADGVPKMEKSRRETSAMEYITDHLFKGADTLCGKEIRSTWQEHEESATMESRIVHDLDKVELLLQMVEYEKRGQGKIDLGEFAYVATKVYLSEMKDWAQDILQEREKFWAEKDIVYSEAREESKRMQDQYYDGK